MLKHLISAALNTLKLLKLIKHIAFWYWIWLQNLTTIYHTNDTPVEVLGSNILTCTSQRMKLHTQNSGQFHSHENCSAWQFLLLQMQVRLFSRYQMLIRVIPHTCNSALWCGMVGSICLHDILRVKTGYNSQIYKSKSYCPFLVFEDTDSSFLACITCIQVIGAEGILS